MSRTKTHPAATAVLLWTTCLLTSGTQAAPEKISPLPSGGGLPFATSPDGVRVVYATNHKSTADSHLYSVRIDGSDPSSPVALTTIPLAKMGTRLLAVEMTFSGRVLFACSDSMGRDLFSNNVFGTDLQRLSTGKSVSTRGTDDGIESPPFLLSPDESRVAFRSPGDNGSCHVFTVPVNGGATVRVTPSFPSTANAIVFRWINDRLTYLTLTITRPEPAPLDVTYDVEASDSLNAGSWTTTEMVEARSTNNGDGSCTVVLRDRIPIRMGVQLKRFIRLKVSPQSQ